MNISFQNRFSLGNNKNENHRYVIDVKMKQSLSITKDLKAVLFSKTDGCISAMTLRTRLS